MLASSFIVNHGQDSNLRLPRAQVSRPSAAVYRVSTLVLTRANEYLGHRIHSTTLPYRSTDCKPSTMPIIWLPPVAPTHNRIAPTRHPVFLFCRLSEKNQKCVSGALRSWPGHSGGAGDMARVDWSRRPCHRSGLVAWTAGHLPPARLCRCDDVTLFPGKRSKRAQFGPTECFWRSSVWRVAVIGVGPRLRPCGGRLAVVSLCPLVGQAHRRR
jgi:hypothetical protein